MSPKQGFEEAIQVMSNAHYVEFFRTYTFYLYMISKCRINYTTNLDAPAAVNFQYDHYNLFINPTQFNEFPVAHRIGIIKHEMLHLILQHTNRLEDRNHKIANYAMDLAVNEDINPHHLPAQAVTHANMKATYNLDIPFKLTFEQYYDILNKEQEKYDNSNGAEGTDFDPYDAGHELASEGDPTIQKAITKSMVEKSVNETQKSRGDLPANYSQWLQILSGKTEVNWQQLIRRIAANKRVDHRTTIVKPNRRLPHLAHLKGKVKDRKFNFLFVADVSGSVSDSELMYALQQTQALLKLTNTSGTLIQVDATAYPPEPLSAKSRKLERKASGGTVLAPAIEMAATHRVAHDAIIVLTDGYIGNSDIEAYSATNKPVIWLSTGENPETFTNGRMRGVKLNVV
jgi:predicted metal-dependent peptidase